jgi:hypothetical protein
MYVQFINSLCCLTYGIYLYVHRSKVYSVINHVAYRTLRQIRAKADKGRQKTQGKNR